VLLIAVSEALRNSERHAGLGGRRVTRVADVFIKEDEYEITLRDDGVGFDATHRSPAGIGVENIRKIMNGIAIGDASIMSDTGGTRVTMRWRRPGSLPDTASATRG
jgi:signal transduction histidine kinase